MTRLDVAHAEMDAAPEDTTKRMAFYERVADGEMFLVLDSEPDGDKVRPAVFTVDGADFALVFDSEDRLMAFSQSPTPFLSAPGRQITAMLAGQGIGLGVNLAVAPSSSLLPVVVVAWLHETLGAAPKYGEAKPSAVFAPGHIPETLLAALDSKLATMTGMAKCAYLAQIEYENHPRTHILAFIDARKDAQSAMASAIQEVLSFGAIEAGAMDVVFLAAQNSVAVALEKHGLRFDLPESGVEPFGSAGSAVRIPGGNRGKPPILR